ncbi:hypothetical protein Tco_0792863 [Tanacetum coccineum]
MRANSHHRLLLVAAVALQRGVATAAAVGPTQARPYDMSNSDKLRHTDNTTLVPPRLPDTLLQRAKISAINLDDYQLDPVTLPPSPSSPFPMAAYQRMITKTDPTQREEALTAYGTETGQGSVLFPETALTVCTM